MKYRDIELKIVRKKTNKNVIARAEEKNTVKISAPLYYSDKMVKDFVEKKYTRLKQMIEEKQKNKISLEDGSKIRIFSDDYNIINLNSNMDSVYINGNNLLILTKKDSQNDKKKYLVEEFLKKVVENEALKIIPFYEKLMNRKINSVKVKKLKSRWGSINVYTSDMNLNYELAFYDRKCLEYVIVHEIAHLYEKNHNEKFYKVIKSYFSDYMDAMSKLSSKPFHYL